MNKLLLVLILLFSGICSNYAQQLDSVITYQLNFMEEFEPESKITYYDNEKEKSIVYQNNLDGVWENSFKTYELYDDKGRLLEKNDYAWDKKWEIIINETNTYSDTLIMHSQKEFSQDIEIRSNKESDFYKEGILVEHIQQVNWIENNDHRIDLTKDTFIYQNGRLNQSISYFFDESNQKLIPYYLIDFSYDDSDNLIQKNSYRFVSEQWQFRFKEDYFYFDGLLEKSINYIQYDTIEGINVYGKIEYKEHDFERRPTVNLKYNWSDQGWLLDKIDTLRYGKSGSSIILSTKIWDTQLSYFKNLVRYPNRIDENGIDVNSSVYKWNLENDNWDLFEGKKIEEYGDSTIIYNYSRGKSNSKEILYHKNDKISTSHYYTSDWMGNWLHFSTSYYYYKGLVNINRYSKNQYLIFPNPTNDIIWINGEPQNISVYNSSGLLLFERKNTQSVSLYNYPSGLYFIKTKDSVSKIVKE